MLYCEEQICVEIGMGKARLLLAVGRPVVRLAKEANSLQLTAKLTHLGLRVSVWMNRKHSTVHCSLK